MSVRGLHGSIVKPDAVTLSTTGGGLISIKPRSIHGCSIATGDEPLNASMNRTLLALVVFTSLAFPVSTASAAEVAPRKAETVGSVELYKDPG